MQAPAKPSRRRSVVNALKTFAREGGRHWPAWFVFIMATAIFRFELERVPAFWYARAGHSSTAFVATVVFPLFWVVVYYAIRLSRDAGLRRKRLTLIAVLGFLIGYPLLAAALSSLRTTEAVPLTARQLVQIYEYSQFFWGATLMAHVLYYQGFARFVTFFGVGFAWGLLLENTGIIMGFFSEHQYQFYLGVGDVVLPAPVATMMGWCIVFYVAIWMAEQIAEAFPRLGRSRLAMALLTSAIGISFDLQVDPMASMSGVWWQWDPRLTGGFLGVPLLNYIAWFSAFVTFSFAYFHYFRLPREPYRSAAQRNLALFVRLPYLQVVTLAVGSVLLLLAEGFKTGPAYQVFVDFIDKLLPYR